MRVELWPIVRYQRPDCFFALDLGPKTLDHLMGLSGGLVSSWSTTRPSRSPEGAFRYRIKSPVMLLTICRSDMKRFPELAGIVNVLQDSADLAWELRMPIDQWVLDDSTDKEEVFA